MQVTNVKVAAGRTFNHPHEEYSNLKPSIVLEAVLQPGEDVASCVKALQAQAEGLVEDHKQGLLKSIEELYQLGQRASEMRGLQQELRRAQDRLEQIRKAHPELAQTLIGEGAGTAEHEEHAEAGF